MADANTVIRALGGQLAEALIAKTIAEVEVGELREREAARVVAEAASEED